MNQKTQRLPIFISLIHSSDSKFENSFFFAAHGCAKLPQTFAGLVFCCACTGSGNLRPQRIQLPCQRGRPLSRFPRLQPCFTALRTCFITILSETVDFLLLLAHFDKSNFALAPCFVQFLTNFITILSQSINPLLQLTNFSSMILTCSLTLGLDRQTAVQLRLQSQKKARMSGPMVRRS